MERQLIGVHGTISYEKTPNLTSSQGCTNFKKRRHFYQSGKKKNFFKLNSELQNFKD